MDVDSNKGSCTMSICFKPSLEVLLQNKNVNVNRLDFERWTGAIIRRHVPTIARTPTRIISISQHQLIWLYQGLVFYNFWSQFCPHVRNRSQEGLEGTRSTSHGLDDDYFNEWSFLEIISERVRVMLFDAGMF